MSLLPRSPETAGDGALSEDPNPCAQQGLEKHDGLGVGRGENTLWRELHLLSEEEMGPEACEGHHPNSVPSAQGCCLWSMRGPPCPSPHLCYEHLGLSF